MYGGSDRSELESAATALCSLLGRLDVAAVHPSRLPALIELADRVERAAHGCKVRAAAKVAEAGTWQHGSERSVEEWLAGITGTSTAEAGRLVATGQQLDRLPEVARAVQAGELSARQAESIAGAAAADPSAQSRLLESAGQRSLRDLQDECRRTRVAADPDPEAAAARVRAKRTYRMWTDADGVTGHLHLSGPIASIARMDNAVRHRADRLFREARTAGRREPTDAYAFDAAEELLTGGGDGPSVPAGADAKLIVRVDHDALQRGHTEPGEVCEIAGVAPIPVSTAREWLPEAFVAVVLTKGVDVQRVVHLGRRFRAVQRTALQWTDPVCARRGCSNRLRLQYDHFEDWAHTRTTRVWSGKRFCDPCHRLKSSGWIVSSPDADGKCDFRPPPGDAAAALAEAVDHAVTVRRARAAGREPPALAPG